MAKSESDDFNRLYERLVVQRTHTKKRDKQVTVDALAPWSAAAETLPQASQVAQELEKSRRQAQQKHDAEVASTAKRLCLARNLRGFAQWMRCSPHRLALHLIDASIKDERRLRRRYQKLKRRRNEQHKECYSEVDQRMRLESIAARLFLRRSDDFQPQIATTLEGRHRVINELLFFSPPNARVLSRIGYAERGNVVPVAPRRWNSQRPRFTASRVSAASANPSLEKANP